jgi:hypothetical protein
MNAGGAPPEVPTRCSLANVDGLLPCVIEDDGQLLELQGPPHPAPGPHIEAVVYLPPRYKPVRMDMHSRHSQQPAATVPESSIVILPLSGDPMPRILTPSRSSLTQSSSAFAAVPYTDGVVYCPLSALRTVARQPRPSPTHHKSSLIPIPYRHHLPERGPLVALSCCRYRKRRRHDVGYCFARGIVEGYPPSHSQSSSFPTPHREWSQPPPATGARATACCRAIPRAQRDRRRDEVFPGGGGLVACSACTCRLP